MQSGPLQPPKGVGSYGRGSHTGNELHQTTSYTADNRYPELFDLAARLRPDAARILSFGCSTGEELVALRRRFSGAEIVGAEINSRSRRIATRHGAADLNMSVVRPGSDHGRFDLVFALAVLQREPHKIAEMEVDDLSALTRSSGSMQRCASLSIASRSGDFCA